MPPLPSHIKHALEKDEQSHSQQKVQSMIRRLFGRRFFLTRAALSMWVLGLTAASMAEAASAGTASSPFQAPIAPPRALYTIDVRLDLNSGRFGGEQRIRFKNESYLTLSRLAMYWPLLEEGGKLSVTVGGNSVQIKTDAVAPDGHPLAVFDLPQALPPGREIHIGCQFRIEENAGAKPEQLLMTQWHPRLWWGFPTVDDFAVKVQGPDGYALACSGRLDAQTGYYECKAAHDFGMFFSRVLSVIEVETDGVLIRCFHPADAEACGRLLLDTAADVVGFYRQRFGFYPHKSLTIISGAEQPMGGYPVATAILAIHGMRQMAQKPRLHWQWITAHEIGHMYFGEHVLERDSPGWLWIGLGLYADREYVRARGLGLDKHRELVARYTEGVRQGLDTTLHRTAEQIRNVGFDYNNVAQHGKGFSVVSALACVLGPETFDRIYLRCLREFSGRRLGVDAFQALCEAESGLDLGWFFDQWVRSNQYLSYGIASQSCGKENDKFISRVRVECRGTLRMPVPVKAWFEDGTSQVQFTDRLAKARDLEFASQSPLKEVQLDPNEELAMAETPASRADLDVTASIGSLPSTGAGKQALAVLEAARKGDLASADLWAKLGLALYDGEFHAEALDAFRRAAERAKPLDSTHFMALVWQGHVLDLLGRREEAMQSYRLALKESGGSPILHDQYRMRLDRAWVEERLKEPFRRERRRQ
jgi:tetratricopeptide (TPR) repeat protein